MKDYLVMLQGPVTMSDWRWKFRAESDEEAVEVSENRLAADNHPLIRTGQVHSVVLYEVHAKTGGVRQVADWRIELKTLITRRSP